jgi:hypothetical protein
MASNQSSDIVRVPMAADLDTWSGGDWRDGLQTDQLAPLDRLLVRTRNNPYEITILDPQAGDVLVRGGRFFPQPTRARLSGASLGGSFLKLHGIYVGFSMEIWSEGETVVTSPVETIEPIELDAAMH